MVDYNIAIPQQQLFQAPDPMQNAMRMQQLQTQNMQMQQSQRTQQQQNALAELMGSGIDMNSPEFRQKAFAVGGLSAVPYAQAAATMRKEDTASRAEEARAGRYRSQSQASDFELGINRRKEMLNRAPGAMVSDEAWAKYVDDSIKEFGPGISLSRTRPSEKDLIAFLSSASDKIRQAEAEAKAAQEAGQFTVQMTPAGPITVNKLGQFGMATELPRDGAPMGGGASAPAVDGAPVAGAAAPMGRAGAAAAPVGFDMDRAKYASGSIESGGRYNAVGPVTNRGDRAYGKYQVMGANIPSWTKEALGSSMTPSEFLASPEAQEKVFETQFGKSVAKYGNPADAASVWFSGRPLAKAGNASDVLGTTVPQYVQKFMAAYEGGTNTPAMMRSPGFASSSGIPANVGLPVAPVLNAFAGQQPPQQGNAFAMQPTPMLQQPSVPVTTAPAQVGPAPSAYEEALQNADTRAMEKLRQTKTIEAEISRETTNKERREAARQALLIVADPSIPNLIKESTAGAGQIIKGAGYTALTGGSTTGDIQSGKLDMITNKVALDLAGGKLGGGFSNEDRDFTLKIVGNMGNKNLGTDQRIAAYEQLKELLSSIAENRAMKIVPGAIEEAKPPASRNLKAGDTNAKKPDSFAHFMSVAKEQNPNVSERELEAYYNKTYGGR
jgi:hypothetical protein